MAFSRVAGVAGLGFVAVLIVANLLLTVAGFPTPSEAVSVAEITAVYASGGGTLRLASALLPAAWLLATVFAVGVCLVLGRDARGRLDPWAVVGLGGVLMQSVVFTAVEATRLAVMSAAAHDPGSVGGLWALHTALFGFNQVFLATALFGLSAAGIRNGVIGRWHARTGIAAGSLLFVTATTSPYGVDGTNPLALLGLAGWLLWVGWIAAFGVVLLRRTER
ncbi:hypothetical protein [Actinoplanes couchii]|uniref:DUF4386 family protein n=1 Tax=Actinoplanes couchii TaxID=403638 RepID=A0ABQ3XKR9_9ACTN|nr:hypothetical protein [Actinoplanes couchii]MDR6319522.1 hypothetical protein [Actinoplanes couchii]GID59089.1 hypothetical protein Aco03nite_074930 [Actinoplanes couchii]